MRRLPNLLVLFWLSGCNTPAVFTTPADQNVNAPSFPSPSPDTTRTPAARPIAANRPIAPKDSLLANPLEVELVAGGTYGDKDGVGAEAQLADPVSILLDNEGNLIVVQNGDKYLRKVTPNGVVTTVFGADGKPLVFKKPKGVAIDQANNLYVADGAVAGNVLKVAPGGTVTSLAGDGTSGFKNGRGEEARFSQLESICATPDGTLFVGEHSGLIRKIAPNGDTTTYAGGGSAFNQVGQAQDAATARFFYPAGLLIDSKGRLLVSDKWQNSVRSVSADGRFVNTLAGNDLGFVDGANPHNKFSKPSQLAVDAQGNVYVADSWNNSVRKIARDGVVTTLVGDGFDGKLLGLNDRARLYQPQGLALTADGTLYIADSGNNRIVKVVLP